MSSIFLLDDDADIRLAVDIWLTKHGYQIQTFNNSSGLIDAIKKFTPDLILLDVWLAEVKDGKTVCSELKHQHYYPNPIYLLSASQVADTDLLNIGADGYIAKPFNLHDLLHTLNKVLS
jgi:two-component system response regulator VanR